MGKVEAMAMVEIIGEPERLEITCPQCQARLRYGKDDLQMTTDKRKRAVAAIVCPKCSGTVKLYGR